MRILIVNYRYYVSGGPERYLFNVKKLLEENGHTVIPFSIRSVRNVASEYEKYFADSLGGQDKAYYYEMNRSPRMAMDVAARLYYSFHVRRRLEKLIVKTNPDIAYILHHYNKLSPSVIDACLKFRLPVVVRLSDFFLLCPQSHFMCNGSICEDCLVKGYHACLLNRCVKESYLGSFLKYSAIVFHRHLLGIYDHVDQFVCPSLFLREKMVQGGFSTEKLTVIKTFVDKANVESELRDEGQYILYIGRLSPEKGVDLLLKAFARSELWKLGIKIHVVGGQFKELEGFVFTDIERTIINHSVEFKGFLNISAVNNSIEGCLFTVQPARWYENLPNAILESYRFMKPVIATNIGSLPEIVIDGKTGLLFRLEDIDDLAEKLRILAKNGDLRKEMRPHIAELLREHTESVHYNQLIRLFGETISRTGTPHRDNNTAMNPPGK